MRLLCFLLLLTNIPLLAQTPEENLEKYWAYRARLQGDSSHLGFLKMGTGPGTCIPMGCRIPEADCERNWFMVEEKCSQRKGKGMLEWGDGSLYLGEYLAVLATEYRNLLDAGQATDSIAKDLWLTLEAFDRLDSVAETYLGMEPALNGFFIRDDAHDSFYLQFDTSQYNCVHSNSACGEILPKNGRFVSQDQVLVLFMGWLLVAELVPEERYLDSLPTFGEKVAGQVDRVVEYFSSQGWFIDAPDGKKVPNQWGGDARALSHGMAVGANRIAGPYTGKDYRNGGSKSLGWMTFGLYSASYGVQKMNIGMFVQSAILLNAWNPKKMDRRCLNKEVEVWALVDAIANDRPLSKHFDRAYFEAILDSAPLGGPCFNSPGCPNVPGWSGYDRWIHPGQRNGNPWGRKLEAHGMDYLLLYNLFHLYFKAELGEYKEVKE